QVRHLARRNHQNAVTYCAMLVEQVEAFLRKRGVDNVGWWLRNLVGKFWRNCLHSLRASQLEGKDAALIVPPFLQRCVGIARRPEPARAAECGSDRDILLALNSIGNR